MVAQPCLGYPSRTAAAKALRDQGLTYQAIADRMNVSANAVSGLLFHARNPKPAKPRAIPTRAPMAMRIAELFGEEERKILREQAARRSMSEERIIQAIVETAIADDLIGAILDDGVAGGRA